MRPTVDNVCLRWNLLYLKTLILRMYLLRRIPVASEEVGFLKFPIFHYDLSTSIFYTHDSISRATSRTTKVSVSLRSILIGDQEMSPGHGVLMRDV